MNQSKFLWLSGICILGIAIALTITVGLFYGIVATIALFVFVLMYLKPILFISLYVLLFPITLYFESPSGEERFFSGTAFSFDVGGLRNISLLLLSIGYFILRRRNPLKTNFIKWYALFLGYSLFSVYIISPHLSGFRLFVSFSYPFLIALVISDVVKSHRDMDRLINYCLYSAIFPLALAIYQFISGTSVHIWKEIHRVYGPFNVATAFSIYLAFLFCLLIGVFFERRKVVGLGKTLFFATLFIFFIVFTYTRATWGALLVAISLILFLKKRYGYILLVLTGVFGIFAFIPTVSQRITELFTPFSGTLVLIEHTSLVARFRLWSVALAGFLQHPIFGIGLGGSALYEETMMGILSAPHNEYIRILLDMGMVGFVFFVGYMVTLLRYIWREYSSNRDDYTRMLGISGLAAFVCFFVFAFWGNPLRMHGVAEYFWIIIGLVLANHKLVRGLHQST